VSVRSAAGGLLSRLVVWAFGPGDPRQLAALRIGLCLTLALRLATRAQVYLSLAEQERELFRPRSYMTLVEQMPSRTTIAICLVAGILAAVLGAAGLLSRTMLAIALLAALLLDGMQTSQGKILHNDVLLVLCLTAIVFARHGDAWSLDAWIIRRRSRSRRRAVTAARVGASPAYGWPLRTAMLIIALAYAVAGLHKLAGSHGLGWASSDNMRWLLYVASDAQGHNSAALWIAERPWAAHLAAYGLLATECLFFLVLVIARLRWVFIPAVTALHLGTWVTLRLDYSAWVLCVIIVFVTWPSALARISRRAA